MLEETSIMINKIRNKDVQIIEQIKRNETFPEQAIAGIEIANLIYFSTGATSTLLISEPQAGKTGAFLMVAQELWNLGRPQTRSVFDKMDYEAKKPLVIVVLQKGDKSNRDQLENRLTKHDCDVFHLNDLAFKSKSGKRLKNMIEVAKLQNRKIILISDEVHMANWHDRVIEHFHDELGIEINKQSLHWKNQNIHVVMVSATPFAHLIKEQKTSQYVPAPYEIFWLSPDRIAGYVGIKEIVLSARSVTKSPYIVDVGDFDNGFLIDKKTWNKNLTPTLHDMLCEFERGQTGFFILRLPQAMHKKHKDVECELRKKFPTCRVETFSCTSKHEIKKLKKQLELPPKRHIIALIKNAFSVGDTLCLDYIEGWWEGGRHKKQTNDTFIQRMRMCGYKSSHKFPIGCSRNHAIEAMNFYDQLPNTSCKLSSQDIQKLTPLKGLGTKLMNNGTGVIWVWNGQAPPSQKGLSGGAIAHVSTWGKAGDLADAISNRKIKIGKNRIILIDAPNHVYKNSWCHLLKTEPSLFGKYVKICHASIKPTGPWFQFSYSQTGQDVVPKSLVS